MYILVSEGDSSVTYVVCTLNGCFDHWERRRSSLAIHLSGVLGDHLCVVVVKQEVVTACVGCIGNTTVRYV